VDLRVAFVHGTILPLDPEKEALHFAERAPVNGRSRSLDWIAVLTVLHRRG